MLTTRLISITLLGGIVAGTSALAKSSDADIAGALARSDRPAADRALDADRKPLQILSFFKLKRGDRVLDVLASPGYYTEIIARAVGPNGSVVAYDPPQFVRSPAAQKNWSSRIKRLGNVRQLLQPLDHMQLPSNSFDLVLLHLAYHETYWESPRYELRRMEPAQFVATLFAATKPGGHVGVVDHVADAGGDARTIVDKLHRIDPAVVRADFERAGFRFTGSSDVLRVPSDDHDLLIFNPKVRGKTDRIVYRFQKPA